MEVEARPVRRMAADAVTAVIGMGPAAARRATERVLDDHPDVDQVVVVGVAGGVDPALQIGDLVVPDVVVDRESGAEFRHTPLGGEATKGALLTGTVPIFDSEVMRALPAEGVVAVDMETAAVADVCEARGVGWSVYRAVSDRPADGLVDERVAAMMRADGSADLGAVARYQVARPWKVTALARLGRDLGTATKAAARAAVAAGGR
jgi:nucleoside phosphorylase